LRGDALESGADGVVRDGRRKRKSKMKIRNEITSKSRSKSKIRIPAAHLSSFA